MLREIYICPQCEVVYSASINGVDHLGCRQAWCTRPWTVVEVVEAEPVRELLADAELVDSPNGLYGYIASPDIIRKLREAVGVDHS